MAKRDKLLQRRVRMQHLSYSVMADRGSPLPRWNPMMRI
jgi:hypothetical protein